MKHLMSALFLLVASTAGAEELKKIAPIHDPAHEDIACADLAAAVIANHDFGSNQDSEKIPGWAAQCGQESSRDICEETQKAIDQANGKIRLRCTGKHE